MCNNGVHVELGWYLCQESGRVSRQALRNEGIGRVPKILCRNRYIEEKLGIAKAAMEWMGGCSEIMHSRAREGYWSIPVDRGA